MPEQRRRSSPQGPPDYKVFRQRRGIFSRLRKPEVPEPAGPARRLAEAARDREPQAASAAACRGPARAASGSSNGSGSPPLGWIALSFLAFAVSAQLQAFKLSGEAKDALHGSPFMLSSAQTILVIGTDARPPDTKEPGAAPSEECFEQQAHGDAPHGECSAGEFRADTLMLIRAGGGSFRKLSIPRDAYAEIPGQSPQKINGAYAYGGAKLQIEAVEQFLGIDVDHVAIVDFTGFEDLIDAVGGVKVDVPVKLCTDIAGGAGGGQGGFTLRLGKGENTLDGQEALIYARTRKASECPGPGPERLHARLQTTIDREKAQQAGHQRDQGPAHRPPPPPLQLHQGPDHRLGRAESLRQRHGLLHDAAAGPLGGDRRQRPDRRLLHRRPRRLRRRSRRQHRDPRLAAPEGRQPPPQRSSSRRTTARAGCWRSRRPWLEARSATALT